MSEGAFGSEKTRYAEEMQAKMEQKFKNYCSDNKIENNRPLNNDAYIICHALDSKYSWWIHLKLGQHDTAPVTDIGKKALDQLRLDFVKEMLTPSGKYSASRAAFDVLLEMINARVDDLIKKADENVDDNKNEVFSMLCLLSGKAFEVLKNTIDVLNNTIDVLLESTAYERDKHARLNDRKAREAINGIQDRYYTAIGKTLGLSDLKPNNRHEIRNACFARISSVPNSASRTNSGWSSWFSPTSSSDKQGVASKAECKK